MADDEAALLAQDGRRREGEARAALAEMLQGVPAGDVRQKATRCYPTPEAFFAFFSSYIKVSARLSRSSIETSWPARQRKRPTLKVSS